MKKMISIIIITFLLIFVSGCSVKKYDGIYEKENKDLIILDSLLSYREDYDIYVIGIKFNDFNSFEAISDYGSIYQDYYSDFLKNDNIHHSVVWSYYEYIPYKRLLDDGNYYVTMLFYDNNNHILGYVLVEMSYFNNKIDAKLIRAVEIPKIFFNYQNVTKRQVLDRIENVKNEYLNNKVGK